MNYIEKIEKERDREFFNPASGTVAVNPDGSSSNLKPVSCDSETQENLDRWNWLISGWDRMTFKEKMGLFTPYLHYVNVRGNYKPEFDERINNEIIELEYSLCRPFIGFKFDPDGRGVPNFIMEFAEIDIMQIPDTAIRRKVADWGNKFGFYHYMPFSDDEGTECCSCNCYTTEDD